MSATQPAQGDQNKLFWGTFVHSKKLDELECFLDTAVCVDGGSGKIVAVKSGCGSLEKAEDAALAALGPGWERGSVAVTRCGEGQFFFPGFIDTHIHASQYPNMGIFGKLTLLEWLTKYTFPLEASLADLKRAQQVYGRCVAKTLAHGTTTAAYYATVDVAATNLLADLCLAAGQRALVGRVCMDAPEQSPEWYRDESAEAAEAATLECIAHIRKIDPSFALVRPVITPRFAPSCTAELMGRLGRLQAKTGLPVQTHISENVGEIDLVRKLFLDTADSYAGVYDAFGLLGSFTILAHAVYLSEAEAELVARRGAKVSHCPCSNTAIASGQAPVRRLLERGIAVGLGTDVSGGYSPSVLEAARQAVLVSRHVAMATASDDGAREHAMLTVDEVLYLATRGGAQVVGLADTVGAFEPGMEFDAQLVGLANIDDDGRTDDSGDVDIFSWQKGWEQWDETVAKWLFNGDDRNTKKVWVRGRLVHERKGGC